MKEISKEELEQLLTITCNTNLIVIGSSYYANRPVLNNFIHHQNSMIRSYFCEKNAVFVPNLTTNKDGFMDYDTKRELVAFLIQNYILSDSSGKHFLSRL